MSIAKCAQRVEDNRCVAAGTSGLPDRSFANTPRDA